LAGANATMAAWLRDHNGQSLERAVVFNIGNAALCAVNCRADRGSSQRFILIRSHQ
jgi:hypothetical protein